ncbi:MAG: nucleoporin protein Ndc1-Nup [Piptocephalis tieghemiana]|nr:MAG: nucleoporin protein Ndc1-Nup [Piptocephalis tieghemiana]
MPSDEDPVSKNRQYLNQAHIELRRRSVRILTVSVLESLALIFLWQLSFSKESLLGIIITRKNFLQVQRPCYTSVWDYAHVLVSPKMRWYVGAHCLSAVTFFTSYHALNGTGYMSLMGGPRGETYLNASLVYNLWCAGSLGLWSALDRIFRQRDHLQFPIVQRSAGPLLKARLPTILVQGFIQPIPFFLLFNLVYILASHTLHRIHAFFFGILVSSTYAPWGIHYLFPPTILLRTYLAMALTVSAWEVTHTAFEVAITKAWRVSSDLVDPFAGMAYAMAVTNIPLIQRCAFLELEQRSRSDQAWRRALYEDAGRPGGHSAWEFILAPCLTALKDQKDQINPPAPAPAAPKPTGNTDPPSDWKAQERLVRERDAMRPRRIPLRAVVKRNVEDAVDEGRAYLKDTAKSQLEKRGLLPWFTHPGATMYAWVKDRILKWTDPWVKGLTSVMERVMQKDKERVPFADVERTVWAAQALGTLVSMSLTEDRYGVVQQDIPRILSSLLDCLAEVEMYAQKIKGIDEIPAPQVHPQCLYLIDVLRRTIYQIVITFWDYLPQMEMEPKLRERVRDYAGFST